MIALIAVSIAFLLGIIGLGVDVGFVVMHQRILKNASDAAAIAGAIKLPVAESAVQTDVNALISQNPVPAGTASTCEVVNLSNVPLQSCSTLPYPNGTAGVRVVLEYTRPTFLMKIVGKPTMTARTVSIARAFTETGYISDSSVFIACGWNAKLTDGSFMDILAGTEPPEIPPPNPPGSGPWDVRTEAINKTFVLHDQNNLPKCGLAANQSFKGLLQHGSPFVTLPAILGVDDGNKAGPTRVQVRTQNGCKVGEDPHNCIMPVPLATQPKADDTHLWAVRWVPFWITSSSPGNVNANSHWGELRGKNVVVSHDPNSGTGSWSKGDTGGLLTVRLAD